MRTLAGRFAGYAILVFFSLVFLYPFVIQIANSFKTEADASASPLSPIPHPFDTASMARIFEGTDFPTWLGNSVLVTVIVTITRVLFGAMGGYAAGVFIMKQFFDSVPVSIEEAARIDGAGLFRTFWSVVLPSARPALITLTILAFQGSWNEFPHTVVAVQDPALFTLPRGLADLVSGSLGSGNQYPLKLGAALLATIPLAIIFVIFQRYFVRDANEGAERAERLIKGVVRNPVSPAGRVEGHDHHTGGRGLHVGQAQIGADTVDEERPSAAHHHRVDPQPKLVQQPLGEQLRADRAVPVHHDVLTVALLERAYRTGDVAVDDGGVVPRRLPQRAGEHVLGQVVDGRRVVVRRRRPQAREQLVRVAPHQHRIGVPQLLQCPRGGLRAEVLTRPGVRIADDAVDGDERGLDDLAHGTASLEFPARSAGSPGRRGTAAGLDTSPALFQPSGRASRRRSSSARSTAFELSAIARS